MNVKQLLEQCKREEFIALDVILRALQVSRRKLMRHVKAKQIPYTQVGRDVRFRSDVVESRFLNPSSPSTRNHSGPSTH